VALDSISESDGGAEQNKSSAGDGGKWGLTRKSSSCNMSASGGSVFARFLYK